MDQYTYTPLDIAKDEVRLIRLLPGALSDDIEIEIFHSRSNSQAGSSDQRKMSKARKLWEKVARKEPKE